MKNSIEGFNQKYATTLQMQVEKNGKIVTRKIDCIDLVILRWFVDFYPNMKKVEVDGKQYAWLTHKKLLEDLPLIDINKRSFIDRMQKLVSFGILTYRLLKESGNFSLYGFGDNYSKLVENDIPYANEQHRVVQSNDIGLCNQITHKDNSIIDNSIIDNNITQDKKHKFGEYEKVLLTDKQYNKLVLDYGEEQTKEAIKYLDEYTQMKGYKCKDHNLALRKWVFNAVKEHKPKQEMIRNNYQKTDILSYYTNLDTVEI